LLEFALVFPILLTLIFGIMEIGRASSAAMIVTHVTRKAARYGIAASEAYTSTGAVNPNLAADVHSWAVSHVGQALSTAPLAVDVVPHCVDHTQVAVSCPTSGARLRSVEVSSTYTVTILTPLLSALKPSVAIGAKSQMRTT
jgi:Flp pilus assembly protein TadG